MWLRLGWAFVGRSLGILAPVALLAVPMVCDFYQGTTGLLGGLFVSVGVDVTVDLVCIIFVIGSLASLSCDAAAHLMTAALSPAGCEKLTCVSDCVT